MLCVTDLGKRDDENTVCRGHPHAHDGSHQGGHAEPGVGIEEKQDDTSERGRQRGDDNEGVSPRLKVDDDQHVYENDRKDQTAKKRDVGAAHGVYLPQNRDRGAPGEVAFESIYNPLNIPSHSSQVAILHRAVDIDDAAHVVLGNDGHLVSAVNGRHISQDLGVPVAGYIDWDILQILYGLHPVLGCLRGHLIVDTVLPVQKEHWGNLEASAKTIEDALAHIARSVSALLGFGPVNIDCVCRIVHRLLHAKVNQAGNLTQLGSEIGGKLSTRAHIVSAELHVNGRGKPKVQNLCSDVGG